VPFEQHVATAAELEITRRKFQLLAATAHEAESPEAAQHFVEAYVRKFDPAKPVNEQVSAWRVESPFYFRRGAAPAPAAPPAAPAPAGQPAPAAPAQPTPSPVAATIPPSHPAVIPSPTEMSRLTNAELDALIARKR
jgi:hypothetical protein